MGETTTAGEAGRDDVGTLDRLESDLAAAIKELREAEALAACIRWKVIYIRELMATRPRATPAPKPARAVVPTARQRQRAERNADRIAEVKKMLLAGERAGDAARAVGLSPSALSEVFKSTEGITPNKWRVAQRAAAVAQDVAALSTLRAPGEEEAR